MGVASTAPAQDENYTMGWYIDGGNIVDMTEGSGGTGLHKGSLVVGENTLHAGPSTVGRENGNGPIGKYNHTRPRRLAPQIYERIRQPREVAWVRSRESRATRCHTHLLRATNRAVWLQTLSGAFRSTKHTNSAFKEAHHSQYGEGSTYTPASRNLPGQRQYPTHLSFLRSSRGSRLMAFVRPST